MDIAGKTAVVTGGAGGIGAALAAQLTDAGARVCVLDLSPSSANCAISLSCDVGDEAALRHALSQVEMRLGPIDLYVSNAGVLSRQPDHAASASEADWARCWSVNVMAHVHAARVLLPGMIARGSGHFVIVASAAGLLNQIGDAAYSATKHAAVSFAELLAITHLDDGIGVTLVCPQYVATPLIGLSEADAVAHDSLLTADEVARCTVDGIRGDSFLVLPHQQVADYARTRAADHERWVKGMARLRLRAVEEYGDASPEALYRLL